MASVVACLIPSVCVLASYYSVVDAFTWQSWVTIVLTLEALLLMANDLPPDIILLAVMMMLRLLGIITEEKAWRGFASNGVLAIGVLFVVAKCQ